MNKKNIKEKEQNKNKKGNETINKQNKMKYK